MRLFKTSILLIVALLVITCGQLRSVISPVVEDFNFDWKFHLGDLQNAASLRFDDSAWDTIQLPHDFSITGKINKDNPSMEANGFFPGGIGWYRKIFDLPDAMSCKQIYLDFDGAYMNTDVYVNGEHAGFQQYGYVPFSYDITPFIRFDTTNVIAVRIDNSQQPTDRWYSGSGIYRKVQLRAMHPVHIPHWGVTVTTPEITDTYALVQVQTPLHNQLNRTKHLQLKTQIISPHGQVLSQKTGDITVAAGSEKSLVHMIKIEQPELWDIGHPALYHVRSTVFCDGEIVHHEENRFGIRTALFDPDQGFLLNGRKVLLKGVNIHHDAGCLGAAVPDDVFKKRMDILQAMGCNAIRLSHNPHAEILLDYADEIGMLIINEMYDKWEIGWHYWLLEGEAQTEYVKRTKKEFQKTWKQDVTNWLNRDKNNPSNILWSVGNETLEQLYAPEDGRRILEQLIGLVRKMDPGRQVTCVMHPGDENNKAEFPSTYVGQLDVVGYNYRSTYFDQWHQQYPDICWFAAETKAYCKEAPEDWGVLDFSNNSWFDMKPYVAGQFIWAGIDYLGEAKYWPDKGLINGIIKTDNRLKPQAYFTKSLYSEDSMVHIAVLDDSVANDMNNETSWQVSWAMPPIVSHWNFDSPEKMMQVVTFTRSPKVELFLNGRSLGVKHLADFKDRVIKWDVPYTEGNLKAVAYTEDNNQVSHQLVTAGPPYQIVLNPDKKKLTADGEAVACIEIYVRDAEGHVCPKAEQAIQFQVEGNGRLLGIDNGDMRDHTNPLALTREVRGGRAIMYVQAGRSPGEITVNAVSEGLLGDEVRITVK